MSVNRTALWYLGTTAPVRGRPDDDFFGLRRGRGAYRATRAIRIVARGLRFANGVALSQDGQTLFVSDTGKYRVWKIAACC